MAKLHSTNYSEKKLQEYTLYFKCNYGADFRPGQGLDELTDMIFLCSKNGTWVDLGGGTSTFIWLPAFKEITNACSVDKYAESFLVQEHNRIMRPSGCYRHILDRYQKSNDDMQKIQITFSRIDLFKDFTADKRYDNVSQFGLLGLCKNEGEYIYQLEKMTEFMCSDAVFLGANWIFSSLYEKKCGFSNSYLDVALIEKYALNSGKELLCAKKVSIADDPYYTDVILYAFRLK